MAAADRAGISHALAECHTCGKVWDSRNAVGVAAQHPERYGHHVVAEQVITMSWNRPA